MLIDAELIIAGQAMHLSSLEQFDSQFESLGRAGPPGVLSLEPLKRGVGGLFGSHVVCVRKLRQKSASLSAKHRSL